MAEPEQTTLLRKIAQQQEESNRIEQERLDGERRENYLKPYRERLEKSEIRAKNSGDANDVRDYLRRKRELRDAERNYTPAVTPKTETDGDKLARLQDELRQAKAEELRLYGSWKARPQNPDLPVKFRAVKAQRIALEEKIKDVVELIREGMNQDQDGNT